MRLLAPQPDRLTSDDLLDLYDPGDGPLLRGGFVLSADGVVAVDGGSRGLQSPADQEVFHVLRAGCDAVLVGAGTVRDEGYGPVRPRPAGQAWRAAHGRSGRPPLVIVSTSLDLPEQVLLPDTVLVTCEAADSSRRRRLAERVAAVVVAGTHEIDLAAARTALHERGLTRLHCEGGPRLLGDLLVAGLVDELCLTHAPLLVGGGPHLLDRLLPGPVPWETVHLLDGDDGVLLGRYRLRSR